MADVQVLPSNLYPGALRTVPDAGLSDAGLRAALDGRLGPDVFAGSRVHPMHFGSVPNVAPLST